MVDENVNVDFDELDDEVEATAEEMKVEAVKRLRKMHIINDAIKQFIDDDVVMVSEPPIGGLYWIDDEQKAKKAEIESQYGGLVYLVIRAYTTFGLMDSYFFVSKYKSEWEWDKEDIEQGIVMTYTYNHDMPDCSEFGSIAFRSVGGGALRVF